MEGSQIKRVILTLIALFAFVACGAGRSNAPQESGKVAVIGGGAPACFKVANNSDREYRIELHPGGFTLGRIAPGRVAFFRVDSYPLFNVHLKARAGRYGVIRYSPEFDLTARKAWVWRLPTRIGKMYDTRIEANLWPMEARACYKKKTKR